jgi:ArsR family transcriptional regulator
VLVPDRELAVDAGTGDGAFLDVLAPIFRRVIAIDRSPVQLARAERRVRDRRYGNVTCLCAELGDESVRSAVVPGADVVVAARMLHHAPRPRVLVESLCVLLRPGGRLVVVDYQRHADEAFRERQADVWNGFDPTELEAHGRAGGLGDVHVQPIASDLVRDAIDGHIGWQVMVGTRPPGPRDAPVRDPQGRQVAGLSGLSVVPR